MRIQIHKRGVIVYGISLILSLAFASFYGGPVSYAWLYGVICLIPLSILYTIINYKFLNIFQEIEFLRFIDGLENISLDSNRRIYFTKFFNLITNASHIFSTTSSDSVTRNYVES